MSEISNQFVYNTDWSTRNKGRAAIIPYIKKGKTIEISGDYVGIPWFGLIATDKGSIGTLGGSFDPDDFDLLSAAIREYNEETLGRLPLITPESMLHDAVVAADNDYFIFHRIEEDQVPMDNNYPTKWEISTMYWVTLEQIPYMLDLVHHRAQMGPLNSADTVKFSLTTNNNRLMKILRAVSNKPSIIEPSHLNISSFTIKREQRVKSITGLRSSEDLVISLNRPHDWYIGYKLANKGEPTYIANSNEEYFVILKDEIVHDDVLSKLGRVVNARKIYTKERLLGRIKQIDLSRWNLYNHKFTSLENEIAMIKAEARDWDLDQFEVRRRLLELIQPLRLEQLKLMVQLETEIYQSDKERVDTKDIQRRKIAMVGMNSVNLAYIRCVLEKRISHLDGCNYLSRSELIDAMRRNISNLFDYDVDYAMLFEQLIQNGWIVESQGRPDLYIF